MIPSIDELVSKLQLQPHPEGGFYRELYRSDLEIPEHLLPDGMTGARSCATSIYYLLTSDSFSAFHRIKQDEIWHFYSGSSIILHIIKPDGEYEKVSIGNNFNNESVPQYTVKAGNWFAAEVLAKDSYALAGCTVSPGFDYQDFELGTEEQLVSLFPKHSALISRLTRI